MYALANEPVFLQNVFLSVFDQFRWLDKLTIVNARTNIWQKNSLSLIIRYNLNHAAFQNKILIRNRRWKQKWAVNDENLSVLDYLQILDVCICLAITMNIVKLVKTPMKTDNVPTQMKKLYKQLFIPSRILFGSLWCVKNILKHPKDNILFFLEGETAPGLRLIDCWIGRHLIWTIGF